MVVLLPLRDGEWNLNRIPFLLLVGILNQNIFISLRIFKRKDCLGTLFLKELLLATLQELSFQVKSTGEMILLRQTLIS